jgi:hypothetical protein
MRQWQALGRAAKACAGLDASLRMASWQGAPSARVLVEQVYETIAELFNAAERAYIDAPAPELTETGPGHDAAPSAGELAQGAPGTPPGKPEDK